MNIIELKVPDHVKYISDWKEYRLPDGHCIVDKDICGCGYTEYCIRNENPYDTILCSPRIVLLKNKTKQHLTDSNILYYQSKTLKKTFLDKQESGTEEYNKAIMEQSIVQEIQGHVLKCRTSGLPVRIMCTYDSFHTVLEVLGDSISSFHVVVDEFQSIFQDSFFKAEIENSFYLTLQNVPNVTYLSATPMLEKYMEKIPGFQNLTYYKLVWPEDKVTKAFIQEHWVSDINKEALKIIDTYKNRPLDRPWKDIGGKVIYSSEVVFYVNSLKSIKTVITKAKLDPSEVNIICSDNQGNRTYIKGIRRNELPKNNRFDIGEPPLEGEPHKMFTFCTKTTYLGADFYSTNAISVILSDANVQSLVVDIRLDLPQILGRQRLKENPWKNECIVFYKTLADGKEITEDAFKNHVCVKIEATKSYITMINSQSNIDVKNYHIDQYFNPAKICADGLTGYYCSVTYDGNIAYNDFLVLAEERAWELTQKDYKSNITVLRSINDTKYLMVNHYTDKIDEDVQKVIDSIKSVRKLDEKFRIYCEFREATKNDQRYTDRILAYYGNNNGDMENYYSHFGIETCRAQGYKFAYLKRLLSDEINSDTLKSSIYSIFKIGEKYILKDIKETLTSLYTRLGINKTPKASDIEEYYSVKIIQINISGKRFRAYQLISLK